MKLSPTEPLFKRDASKNNDAASLITMESAKDVTHGQKEKLTKYLKSIGDIMW